MNRSLAVSIFTVIVILIVGAAAYQVGVGQGLAMTAQPAVEGARYAYHPGWGFGFFPVLGLLFPILFLFLIFGLVRAAFGGPRWGNGGPWMDRRTMAEQWHKQMHASEGERRSDTGTTRPGA